MVIPTKQINKFLQQELAQVGNGTKKIWRTVIKWKNNDGTP